MLKQFLFLTFLVPVAILAQQTLNGKVYDDQTTVKGARIYNETQNTIQFSNDNGEFSIEAEIGDNLVIHSLFHDKIYITLTASHFENIAVFELKKFTNELSEVEIIRRKDKKFDSIASNEDMSIQIANDVKNRPYLYNGAPSGNMDFMAIGRLIGNLFKKKNKIPDIIYLSSKDIENIFKKNSFFTQKLLMDDLNIKPTHNYLFFEYCSAQNIDSKLIDEGRTLELLEQFLIYSREFNQFTSEKE